MACIQLEFELESKSWQDVQFSFMQQQLDMMNESMGKVRRRIFSELGEMKKLYDELQKENAELKLIIYSLKNEKKEWLYNKEGFLFY